MADTPEEQFTEVTDAEIDRVDLVDKAANGLEFIMAKSLMPSGLVESLVDGETQPDPLEQVRQMVDEAVAKATEAAPLPDFEYEYPELAADLKEFEKRTFSAEERRQAAKSGAALPDGSYPIQNANDLHNAIHAIGRGSHHGHAEIHDHIVNRAKALGLTNMLPDSWSGNDGDADDVGKSAITTETIAEMVKAAVAEAGVASKGRVEALEAELAKVKATPIPGGPVLMRTASAPAAETTSRAQSYRDKAAQPGLDPGVASEYLKAARELERDKSS